MPCYQVRTTTVQFEVANVELLIGALLDTGLASDRGQAQAEAERVVKTGRLTVAQGREDLIDATKRSYAARAVKQAAKRYGWRVTQSGKKYQLARR
jgi:hypothetical protein